MDNDVTLELLYSQTGRGSRPSGRRYGSAQRGRHVAAIRHALDDADFSHLPIMSYAVKYSSAFTAFRDARALLHLRSAPIRWTIGAAREAR